MALVANGDKEYLYFPDTTQSVRFRVEPRAFIYDNGWSQTYLTPGATEASSDVYMGGGVVFYSCCGDVALDELSLDRQVLRVHPQKAPGCGRAAARRRPAFQYQVAIPRSLDSVVGGVLLGLPEGFGASGSRFDVTILNVEGSIS